MDTHTNHGDPATLPLNGELAAFFLSLGGPDAPAPIVTHAACVFFTAAEAIKVKRPVRLGYLDYSSPEKRRAACEKEWRLNVVNAPALYLGVTSVVRRPNGQLALDAPGELVETVVRMRRFDQDDLFAAMAKDGRLTSAVIERLAGVIRQHHAAAPPARDARSTHPLTAVLDGLEAGLADHRAALSAQDVAATLARCRVRLAEAQAELHRRASAGLVRRCHGDLHLANIVMWRDEPTLFDALEFDDALATIDVLYDLAFVLMDLRRCGLSALANALLNAYLGAAPTDELRGLRALGAMMALRAGVRARVALDGGKPDAPKVAAEYLGLVDRVLADTQPRLIAVGGLSGSGKSVLARALAPLLEGPCGAVWLRSDVERKAIAGVAPAEPAPTGAYTPEMTDAVYRRLRDKAAAAVREGCVVIVDAVHAGANERAKIETVAQTADVPFTGLWLDCDEDERARRAAARRGDASDAGDAVARMQAGFDLGDMTWTRFDAGRSVDAVLGAARRHLGV